MGTSSSPLGLLLDVDGPIASPVTRTISEPGIIRDLVTLAGAGVPIAFITGRSLAFMRDRVVAPLVDNGLPQHTRMYGICEKGGVWFAITSEGMGEVGIDTDVALPETVVSELRHLVAREYSDTMFFDGTKQVMVSVEQRTDVDHGAYVEAQARFNSAAFDLLAAHGAGVRFGNREAPDAQGQILFRVESTIISTDVESIALDKDSAAERALDFFARNGPLPLLWRSVGDSRSDYLMADHVHAVGHKVAHIDVRPADGILERPYPVIAIGDQIHDEAGASFLAYWVEKLGLR